MNTNNRKLNSATGFSDFLLAKNSGMRKSRAAVNARSSFGLFGKSFLRATAMILLFTMGAALLRGMGQTTAYLADTEISQNNEFVAGTLDFSLTSEVSTTTICTIPGEPLEKIIRIHNHGNPFKYQISAGNFSSEVCDYVSLSANLGDDPVEYTGPLTGFDYGLTVFADPSDWTLTLSISSSTPLELRGQVCEFDINIGGSQTRHELPFPEGFSDQESTDTDIQAGYCDEFETRTIGYWKNHPETYLPHLPQTLGATSTDETISTQTMVNAIFDADDSIMRNKLKKQLLGMKFNIAHFGMGDYVPTSSPDNMITIVAQADNLLRQIDPEATDSEMEIMKNLLDYVNNLHLIDICTCVPPEPGKILLNEFLPNPKHADDAAKPQGEWVELYNNGDLPVDVSGWALYDAEDSHELVISLANINATSTIINPQGFLVVFRDGDADFSLDDDGDSLRLFNGIISEGADLLDSYTYTETVPENKSYARIPDGFDNWVDPIPSPGDENYLILDEELTADQMEIAALPELIAELPLAETLDQTSSSAPAEGTETVSEPVEPTEPDALLVEETVEEPAAQEPAVTAELPATEEQVAPPEEPVPSEVTTIEEPAAPADPVVPEVLSEPLPDVSEPVTAPEEPTNEPNPAETTLITQPLAPIPPEIIIPEAPVVTDSGSGI